MLELSLKGVDPNIVGCNRSERSCGFWIISWTLNAQGGSSSWTSRHRKDKPVQSTVPKACHQVSGAVKTFSFYITLGWVSSSKVASLWRSIHTVSSPNGFRSLANWCRRCSQRSRGSWRIKSETCCRCRKNYFLFLEVSCVCSHRWGWVADSSQEGFWIRAKWCNQVHD